MPGNGCEVNIKKPAIFIAGFFIMGLFIHFVNTDNI